MSKNGRARANDQEIDISTSVRFFTPYSKIIALSTVLSIGLALFLQVASEQIAAMIVYPIAFPIVASYWLAAYLPGAQYYWVAIFAVLSLMIHSFLFLPLLMRTKFRTKVAFVVVQGMVLTGYLLINCTFYKVLSGWMSV